MELEHGKRMAERFESKFDDALRESCVEPSGRELKELPATNLGNNSSDLKRAERKGESFKGHVEQMWTGLEHRRTPSLGHAEQCKAAKSSMLELVVIATLPPKAKRATRVPNNQPGKFHVEAVVKGARRPLKAAAAHAMRPRGAVVFAALGALWRHPRRALRHRARKLEQPRSWEEWNVKRWEMATSVVSKDVPRPVTMNKPSQ
jgi:hypothetical protein